MNKIRAIAALLLPFAEFATNGRSPKDFALRISVLSSGKILLDGKKATVSEVKKALTRANSEKGAVWYYRESGKGEPPVEAIEIFKFMVESKLPISLSTKPDFSDYIDDQGQSHPRK
jgi:hypothetical protein